MFSQHVNLIQERNDVLSCGNWRGVVSGMDEKRKKKVFSSKLPIVSFIFTLMPGIPSVTDWSSPRPPKYGQLSWWIISRIRHYIILSLCTFFQQSSLKYIECIWKEIFDRLQHSFVSSPPWAFITRTAAPNPNGKLSSNRCVRLLHPKPSKKRSLAAPRD